jgi:SAM-dependent methyltransferase
VTTSGRRPGGHADFAAADLNLVETLHSLDGAVNYADWVYSAIQPHLGSNVLEVGAGHGTLTGRLARGRKVTATDLSPRCVAVLRERFANDAVAVVHADLTASADLGTFDSVVLVNVLEHIEDDERSVVQASRALRPGGRLIVFVPAFDALYSEFDRRVGHHRRYRKADLQALADAAGLAPIEARYMNSLGAVAWWLFATKLGRTPTTRWPVLLYDRAVVRALRRIEQRWEPPFGQSLLCVACRPAG